MNNMEKELNKVLKLLESSNEIDNKLIDVETIKLNSNEIDILEVIGTFKIRKRITETKSNLSLANSFDKLIKDLEIAAEEYSHVRILSFKLSETYFICYLDANLTIVLGSLSGELNQIRDGNDVD